MTGFAARWPRELSPEVAADVLRTRNRPIRFLRLGRFVLVWEKR